MHLTCRTSYRACKWCIRPEYLELCLKSEVEPAQMNEILNLIKKKEKKKLYFIVVANVLIIFDKDCHQIVCDFNCNVTSDLIIFGLQNQNLN
jgi:hypothetical protein